MCICYYSICTCITIRSYQVNCGRRLEGLMRNEVFVESWRIVRDSDYYDWSTGQYHSAAPTMIEAKFACPVEVHESELTGKVFKGINTFLRQELTEIDQDITGLIFENSVKCDAVISVAYEYEGIDSVLYRRTFSMPVYRTPVITGVFRGHVVRSRRALNPLTI